MKFTNADVLLRNRRLLVKARDAAFGQAARLIDDVVALYGENGVEIAQPGRLAGLMAEIVDRLYHARYFARLSVGGDGAEPVSEADVRERAYIDHVETMYSYSRSINRFLRHEHLIDSFVGEHPDVPGDIRSYLAEIRKSDVNLIYHNLLSMRNRLKLFEKFMNLAGIQADAAVRG
jgi:hypothetical protein